MARIVHGVNFDVDVVQASRSWTLQAVATRLTTEASGSRLTTLAGHFCSMLRVIDSLDVNIDIVQPRRLTLQTLSSFAACSVPMLTTIRGLHVNVDVVQGDAARDV